jgi:hypothetical protein
VPTYSSRKRPWPWDLRVWSTPPLSTPPKPIGSWRGTPISGMRGKTIGSLRQSRPSWSAIPGTGMILLPQQNGILIGKKQTIVETVVPTAQSYESAPIYKERVFSFKPNAGMGERQQSSTGDERYHYALDCWVLGGLFGKGPYVHRISPPPFPIGPVRQFIDGLNAARASTMFVLDGEYVLAVTDDTTPGQVTVIQRAGAHAQSATRFQAFGTTPIDAVYVAWSDGVLTQIGPTNVACVLPAGMHANYVEKIGRELWIADAAASVIRSTSNDPLIAGSWSGPIQIGDTSVPITCLRAAGGVLWILKANGDVFSVSASGTDNDWFPSQAETVDLSNGRTATSWLGNLWYRAGPTFYQMSTASSPSLQPIGPERNVGNASQVQGPVQAFCGWGAHLAFCAIYNDTGVQTDDGQPTSYLLTYGNWEPQVQTQPTGPSLAFVDQYDGAIAHWPGRKISALYITSSTVPPRLYCGFEDGGYDWFKLVPNPLTPNSGAEFTLGPARMVPPLFTDMFEANTKQIVGVSGFGPRLNWGDNATISYRVRGSTGTPGPMGATTWHVVTPPITQNGQRINFPDNVAGISCEFRVDLANLSMYETPVFEGLGFASRVVPDFRYDWTLTIDARDYVQRKDGSSVRQSGRIIRNKLVELATLPNTATIEMPDETIEGLAFVQYQERLLPWEGQGARFGQQWAIDVQLTQFSTTTDLGIIRRQRGNTIGSLRGLTITDLRTM